MKHHTFTTLISLSLLGSLSLFTSSRADDHSDFRESATEITGTVTSGKLDSTSDVDWFQVIVIAVPTEVGVSYRVETSSDMATWTDACITLQGDGTVKNVAFARAEALNFFRAMVR